MEKLTALSLSMSDWSESLVEKPLISSLLSVRPLWLEELFIISLSDMVFESDLRKKSYWSIGPENPLLVVYSKRFCGIYLELLSYSSTC